MAVLVEACVESVSAALAAEAGGAGRVELCDNLVEGGTTPSLGTVAVARERLTIPIHVIVRPRGGDFLYSPVEGNPELRRLWNRWQREGIDEPAASTLPVVTAGLTHGLSLVADLFGGEERAVAVPAPFWGNYRQTFATRTGARMVSAPAYRDNRYNCEALAEALALHEAGSGGGERISPVDEPDGGEHEAEERG